MLTGKSYRVFTLVVPSEMTAPTIHEKYKDVVELREGDGLFFPDKDSLEEFIKENSKNSVHKATGASRTLLDKLYRGDSPLPLSFINKIN